MDKYGFTVYVEPWTEKIDFWKAIEKYDKVYYVAFELHMPNFLGRTQKDIKEMLEKYEEQHNATSLTSKLSNNDGNLKVSKNDENVDSSLEWISKGVGNWAISAGNNADTKTTITSKKNEYMRTVETTIELKNYSIEEVSELIEKLNLDSLMDDKLNGNQEN